MMCWSRNETSKLISIFHRYPILYCVNHPLFNKKRERTLAYTKICRSMLRYKTGIKMSDVRQKLKNLRNQYNKEKTVMLDYVRNGQPNVYVPKLWCFEELQIMDLQDPPEFSSEEEEEEEEEEENNDKYFSDFGASDDPLLTPLSRSKTPKLIKQEPSETREKCSPEKINYKTSEACTTPQAQLGKIVEWELLQVSDDIFNDTKFKIMRLLENASRR